MAEEEAEMVDDPTAMLIRARKLSGEDCSEARRAFQLLKEMNFFEANVGMEKI